MTNIKNIPSIKNILWVFIPLIFVSTQLHGESRNILFMGDSITAGMGIGAELAFPAHIETLIEEAGLDYKVTNAGISGETTAGGLRRMNWVLKKPVHTFVLELGANDMLRGQDLASTEDNLRKIILKVRVKNPEVNILLAGMLAPPNLGPEYTAQFKSLFENLAEEMNVILIPFLLEGVGGEASLNQTDGIHPNKEGHKILAKTVWKQLQPLLDE